MNELSSISCDSNRTVGNNLINTLGCVEHYDATQVRCISFSKATDMADGINVRLTNMAKGYPFAFGGVTWHDSEMLYLCGEFSNASSEHLAIQQEMYRQTSGFAAKRFIKTKYKSLIRQDFADFRIHWMLFVVWAKCKGNAEFARLLSQIPSDAVIIENTTKQRCATKEVWGCSNQELTIYRDIVETKVREQAKESNTKITKKALDNLVAIETSKINNIGVFIGENNLGKILMICRNCLIQGIEPPIDYNLLNSKNIHILGIQLSFPTNNTPTYK